MRLRRGRLLSVLSADEVWGGEVITWVIWLLLIVVGKSGRPRIGSSGWKSCESCEVLQLDQISWHGNYEVTRLVVVFLEASLEWIYFSMVIQCDFPKELNSQVAWNWSSIPVSQAAPTLVAFPLMGVGTDFTVPAAPTSGNVASRSTLVPDECINPHPRNLTQNEISLWLEVLCLNHVIVSTDSNSFLELGWSTCS